MGKGPSTIYPERTAPPSFSISISQVAKDQCAKGSVEAQVSRSQITEVLYREFTDKAVKWIQADAG